MKSVNFEYGDLVIYSTHNIPHVGRYVRRESGKFIIVPEERGKGNKITRRKPEEVIKIALIYKNYTDEIKRQQWSLE